MAANMGMGREMIDWNKPIETVDGCEARFIGPEPLASLPEARIVHVKDRKNAPWSCGDVFLVNDEGYRCDDRAIYSKRQEPLIRNVRVKRKAWIRLAIHDFYKGETKEEIEKYITKSGYKAVYCEWEE